MTAVGTPGTTPDVVAAAIRGLRDRLAELDAEIARVDPLRVERDQVQRALDALDAIGPAGASSAAPEPAPVAVTPPRTVERLVPIADAAKALGVHVETLRKRVRAGDLESRKDSAGRVRVDVREARRVAADRRKPVARTASGAPVRKYTDEAIDAAVRQLRVFTVRRFATAVGAADPAAVYTYVYRLRDAGVIREVETGVRRAGRYYVAADYRGAHSLAIAQGHEPVPEEAKPALSEVSAGESRMLERTRDFVAQQRTSFTPLAVAEALGIDKGAASALLGQLAARGIGGWVDDDHMQYRYERPTDPGPGARFNADGPGDETRRVGGNGQPVPGTGSSRLTSDKEVLKLIARLEAAGGKPHKTGDDHIEVVAPNGSRFTVASTPSRFAPDRILADARRAGLDV